MFDNFRFAADDDLDDFGYEEEHLDIQPGANEYGPEDEDEDELTPTAPGNGGACSAIPAAAARRPQSRRPPRKSR